MLDSTLTVADLHRLAAAGASLNLDGGAYVTDDLARIARALRPGATLTLHRLGGRPPADMARIAAAAPGQVVLA